MSFRRAESGMLNLDTHILVLFLTGDLSYGEYRCITDQNLAISDIVLWELASGKERCRIELPAKLVRLCQYSQGGHWLAASNAVQRILAWYPNGFHTDRAVLLTGQEIGRAPRLKYFRPQV